MKSAPARALVACLAICGPACQPQQADRAVRAAIDLKRPDGGGSPAGTGGADPNDGGSGGSEPLGGSGGAGPPSDAERPVADAASPDAGPVNVMDAGPRPPDGAALDTAREAAASPDLRAPDLAADASRADTGADGAGDDLIARLLAMTPAACAMKVGNDFPLDDAGGAAAICAIKGAYYWVADLDVSCDGRDGEGSKCPAGHGTDTFVHNVAGQALSAATTAYVVVPASPANLEMPAIPLKPGTVVAVINRTTRRIAYGVFGDIDTAHIGAASYACAEQLGLDPTPGTGGQPGNSVTYVAFTDATAVPRNLESATETRQIGETLAAKLIVDNGR